jgi:hypothetical protein
LQEKQEYKETTVEITAEIAVVKPTVVEVTVKAVASETMRTVIIPAATAAVAAIVTLEAVSKLQK